MNDMQTLPFIGSLFASFLFSLRPGPGPEGNGNRRGPDEKRRRGEVRYERK